MTFFFFFRPKLFQQKGRAKSDERERELKNAEGEMEAGMSSSPIGNTAGKNELEADEKEFAFNDVWEVQAAGRSDCAPQSGVEKKCAEGKFAQRGGLRGN